MNSNENIETITKKIEEKYKNGINVEIISEVLYVHFKEDSPKELTGAETLAVYPNSNITWSVTYFRHLKSEEFKPTTEFSKKTKTFDMEEVLTLFDACHDKMVKDSVDFWKANDDLLKEMNIPLPFFRKKI